LPTFCYHFVGAVARANEAESTRVKYWEAMAEKLSKAGFRWGCSSEIDSTGRVIFTADAYARDGRRKGAAIRTMFYSGQHFSPEYVHLNMKTLLLRFWARISRKLTGKPQQMELNLWTRRSRR
jgi:hypothetical protein